MTQDQRLGPLDGLGGVAILLVFVYHAWWQASGITQMPADSSLLSFLYAGSTGVTLFFVLSGLLVTRPFFRAARQHRRMPSLMGYAVQRALRILPPYYAVGLLLYLMVISKTLFADGQIGFETQHRLILSVLGQLPAFLVGMGLVRLFKDQSRPSLGRRDRSPALGAIVWIMLVREPLRLSLLDNRWARHFGQISFSLYLVHVPAIHYVERVSPFGLWGTLVLALILSIALAQALHWLVERPSLALKIFLTQSQPLQGIKV